MSKLLGVCFIVLLSVACKSVEKPGAMADYANPRAEEEAGEVRTGAEGAEEAEGAAQEAGDERLDYGSPRVQQELLDEHTFLIREYATDKSYGYVEQNPIMVGGGSPRNQRRFLNALTGPGGEQISYQRRGSCCFFRTQNGIFGDTGLLDVYVITYAGLGAPIILYINMYDSDVLKVPVGFRLKAP